MNTTITRKKLTSKNQVVIPKPLLKHYNIAPFSLIEFTPHKDGILIKPAPNWRDLRGMLRDSKDSSMEMKQQLKEEYKNYEVKKFGK